MKWYFASRMRHQQDLIKVAQFLQKQGETFSSDWVFKNTLKPYVENLAAVHPQSKSVVQSILESDIFVLISDPEGTDMFVELGIALAKNYLSKNIKIYAVGEYSKRSLMQLHPSITHVPDLAELFKREGLYFLQ